MRRKRFNIRWWLQVFWPAALLLLFLYIRHQYMKPGLVQGAKAPAFQAISLQGDTLRLEAMSAEKYLLLYFWGSWCSVCRKENPKWLPVYERWAHTGKFDIIGIAIEQDAAKWKAAIARDQLPWPVQLADGIGLNLPPALSISELYEVKSVPTKYLLKPGGKIIAVNPSPAKVNRMLEKALK